MAPILNYGLYPFLRKAGIHYGPIARITTGLALSSIGGAAYTVLNYYAYKLSPCGEYGSTDCTIGDGVAPISIWYVSSSRFHQMHVCWDSSLMRGVY